MLGTYKKCFFDGQKLYYYCKNKTIYHMNKANYCAYAELCPYPFAKTYSFNDRKQLICSEYIKGSTKNDKYHLLLWAKMVLKMAKNAPYEIKGNTLYYLQHGDAWYANIIWQDEGSFTYIDLDRLGMWPALYDVIYGLLVSFQEDAFVLFERDLFNDIKDLFFSLNLEFSFNTLDIYYMEYLKIWFKRKSSIAQRYIRPFYKISEKYLIARSFLKNNKLDIDLE